MHRETTGTTRTRSRRFLRIGLGLVLCCSALLAALSNRQTSTSSLPFAPPVPIVSTADGVRSLSAADVDRDGDLDLVAALESSNTIVWYANEATGTIWPEQVVSNTSAAATAVMVVDINRDGLPDILSASHDDDTIAWHEQSLTTIPSFTERVITEDPDGIGGAEGFIDGPRSVFAADLDQDGDPDVLSASENDGHVAWFENVAGDGTIWNPRSIDTTLGGARSVTAADVDGDGDLDVLAAGGDDDTIAWYENSNGDGTVWVADTISTSADGASFVAAADVDLDGDLDVLSSSALDDTIAWHENVSGDGTAWSPHVIDPAADGAAQASPVDLDRDGDTDVLAVRPGEETVTWYENETGDGSAWAERVLSTAVTGAGVAIAFDPDTDGDLDVVSASPIQGEILQHENVVIGRTAAFFDPSPAGSENEQILLDDLDGDGILDLVAVDRRYSLDWLNWHPGQRDGGGFGLFRNIDLVDDFYAIATADVDLDGDVDVIAETPESIYWYENAMGDGTTWTERTVGNQRQFGLAISTADVDGDGDEDVLATQIESTPRVVWYENRVNDPLPLLEWPATPLATVVSNPATVSSGDLDGDGDLDIVVSTASDTNSFAYWHENVDGVGAFGPVRMISTEIHGSYGSHVTVVDLDHDGDNDILAVGNRYPAADRAFIWFENTMGDASSWTTRLPPISGGLPQDVLPADMDLDGDLDIVVAMWYRNITWWENSSGDAMSWTEHEILTELDDSAEFLAIGDLDLDGDPDVVANNRSGPFWHENVGGQYSLPTSDIVTYPVEPSQAVLEIAAVHEGRPGDPDIELQTIELLFEAEPGEPLSSGEANNVIEHLRVYLDDGSGEFEVGTDVLVIEIGDLVLVSGIQTVSFDSSDPLVVLTPGITRTYFVVLEQADTFLEPPILKLHVTHNTETGGTAEDIGANLPVAVTRATNVTSGSITFNTPEVTRVSPSDDELEVGVGSNVTLTFSTALDPSSVSSSTIRLLDPQGMTVPAEILAGRAEQVYTDPASWPVRLYGFSLSSDFPISIPERFQVADIDLSFQMKNLDVEHVSIDLTDPSGEVTIPLWPQCALSGSVRDLNVVFDDDGNAPVCESPVQGIISPPPDTVNGLGRFRDRYANGDWNVEVGIWTGGPQSQATLLHLALVFERWLVTVNPLQPLAPDTVYTLQVTDGVRSDGGTKATPFTASFHTESTPGSASDLSSVSESAEGSASWELGHSVAWLGDFNGDGLDDYAVGAPGYSLDAKPEVGAALLFLGREDAAPPDPADLNRTQPDVIFVGESAHDRVGVSLARTTDMLGTYSFDPAILIGAEQVNRTDEDDPVAGCDAGAPCGPGRVFMVRFASSTYPNLDDPSVTDIVTLEPNYPIYAYEGEALGDRAGYAVAGDGRSAKGPLRTVLIGAPGRDTAQGVDSGTVYLIHESASVYTSGNREVEGSDYLYMLERVANSWSDEIPGMVIEGEAAGDQFGSSVAFRGDLSATVSEDVIVGAPFSDAVAPDGGAVYFVRGGELPTAVATAADIGGSLPGTRVLGDSPGAQLGYAVADGGNQLTDGGRDLLLGAPGYDDGSSVDVGLVAHVGTDLPEGTVQLSSIGNTLPGLLWIGSQAGDRLGSAVAGVGDVTGNGLDDILLSAPAAAGSSNPSAGRIYLIEGSIRDDLLLGSLAVSRIGHDLGGRRYDGLSADELAGFSVSGGGDFDADGRIDWIAGAPAYGLDDQGRVFFVTETRTPPCGPDGCVVAHLATGARLELFAGSLIVATDIRIVGLADAGTLPAAPPTGTALVGAAVLSPDALAPSAPPANLHVPARETMTEQLIPSESLDLWRFDGAAWVDTGIDGVVVVNAYHSDRLAVETDVDTFQTYAVFVPDIDQDDYRNSVDCDNTDDQIWTTPGEARAVRLSHDTTAEITTISWSSPEQPGATSVRYDTLRSINAFDFVSDTICLETGDETDTTATDDSTLLPGELIFYLVRAENDCPSGTGTLGQDSGGAPRSGILCP